MEVIKGRMYDYNNGRFLSVDLFIQNPTSTQSMNPYTYIFNNPLSGVDPSGYIPCRTDVKGQCDGSDKKKYNDDLRKERKKRQNTSRGFSNFNGARSSGSNPNVGDLRSKDPSTIGSKDDAIIKGFNIINKWLKADANKYTADAKREIPSLLEQNIKEINDLYEADIISLPQRDMLVYKARHLAGAGLRAPSSNGDVVEKVLQIFEIGYLVKTIFKVGGRVVASASDNTFEIISGVRRTKAAELNGNTNILAEIIENNVSQGIQKIKIKSLLSPNKSVIDVSTNVKMDRFMNVLDATKKGKITDPILIEKGANGIKINKVELDAVGNN